MTLIQNDVGELTAQTLGGLATLTAVCATVLLVVPFWPFRPSVPTQDTVHAELLPVLAWASSGDAEARHASAAAEALSSTDLRM